MTKKYQKSICAVICFLVFLNIGFFYMSLNRAYAVNLEVNYPEISGQNLNTDSNLTLPSYIKYLFNAGMFIGFFSVLISLIIAGVMYFLSPVSADMRSNAKDRVSGAISGLLILVLTYLIITTINPQLSFLKLNALPPPPPPPAETKAPGVYFYKSGSNTSGSGCSDESVQPNTSSIPDLGSLKNRVGSVDIVQGTENENSYISILYDNVNLWGKCQYVDPNAGCQPAGSWVASASIYAYDFHPENNNASNGGVYFYRKSCFNNQDSNDVNKLVEECNKNSGGYYKVAGGSINNIYKSKLEDLKFNNVPQEEQDCTKYSADGKCASRNTPSLGGENISSIIINGSYLVLFTYASPGQSCDTTPWASCQEFPTVKDESKLGPQQIKWENIRNSNGVIPNCVIIFPIKGGTRSNTCTNDSDCPSGETCSAGVCA